MAGTFVGDDLCTFECSAAFPFCRSAMSRARTQTIAMLAVLTQTTMAARMRLVAPTARAGSTRASAQASLARRVLRPLSSAFIGVGGIAVAMSATPAEAGSEEYSMADQQARFAKHKAEKNERVLDIDKFYDPAAMKGRRVLVTGGNRGLGLALVDQLLADGADVTATTRSPAAELEKKGVTVISGIEMQSDEAMDKLIAGLSDAPFDVVINNAGYFWEPVETLDNLNFEEELKMIDICALGPLRVSAALVKAGLIKSDGKIAMITSQGGSISWRDVQNPEGHDYGHHSASWASFAPCTPAPPPDPPCAHPAHSLSQCRRPPQT